jgi:hypothetical protein
MNYVLSEGRPRVMNWEEFGKHFVACVRALS